MSAAPDGRRANDVAEIRDWLVEHLEGDVGHALTDWGALSQSRGLPAPTSVQVELNALSEAKLFWVPPEETNVIADAATDLPDSMVLEESFIPSPSGFVVFGGNWYGLDAKTGEKSIWPIRGFRWGPVSIPDKCGPDGLGTIDAIWRPGIAISAYSFTHDMRGSALDHFSREYIQEQIDKINVVALGLPQAASFVAAAEMSDDNMPGGWMPLGRSDWIIGEHWKNHTVYAQDHVSYASVIEDRCLMAALWGLMAACAPVEHVPNRAERRRAERRGRAAVPVRIVTWRGPQGQRVVSPADPTGRHIHVRYWVDKFWARRAYGPGRSLRRWVLIPGHWRGPEDAPLADAHTTIHKIVGR